MEKIKVLVIADQEDLRFDLKHKLTNEMIALLGFSRRDTALEKAISLMPNVILLADAEDGYSSLDLAEKIYVMLPGCSVVLLCPTIDMRILEKAMNTGVRKVMPFGCSPEELIQSIKSSFSLEKSRVQNYSSEIVSTRSKIITVFGAKGGTGKTTISVNLAVALAHTGKKVAVVDLDLQFGDVNLFFDLEPRDTIAELVQDKQNFDIDTIRSFIKLHSSGVSVLCAPKSPEFAEIIRGEHIEKIINTIRPYYDYIVIDTPPIFNETTIAAVENSDVILLAITLDISSLRNTKISIDIFESLQQKEKIQIIVNRNAAGIISIKDAQNILDFPVKYKISNDWKTATAALNKGVPIIIDSPRSIICHELAGVGKSLVSHLEA